MKSLSSKQIRKLWLDFWKSKNHQILPSESLVPVNDENLLWINSGVATLKEYFSGQRKPPSTELANSQKCIRTNDIENVGFTSRHHTFFEMLGNFSIGGYFKDKALDWAYELIFKVFKFPKSKIYITYFKDDLPTYKKWQELGVSSKNLIAGTRKQNFWDLGQGPCGPDTEIFYDRGDLFDPEKKGILLLENDEENERYIEIWNIVFSEFNNDGKNNYTNLLQKNIDTGAGLERITAIFQNTFTNFETDLFLPIIKDVEKLTTQKYQPSNYFVKDAQIAKTNKRFRIIADHIRAIALSLEDGVRPSNIKRGYIIRKLIRRAYVAGLQLGITKSTFLYLLVPTVAKVLDYYPLRSNYVAPIIEEEEELFAKTISKGEELLQKELAISNKNFNFAVAFKLFETYGFPIELTQQLLTKQGIKLDTSEFESYKQKHATISQSFQKKGWTQQIQVIQKIEKLQSAFVGYTHLKVVSKVLFAAEEKGKWYVLLDKTPFYAAKGGQQSDKGTINDQEVEEVFSDKHDNIWHVLNHKVEGVITAQVFPNIRIKKEANHSATHLLGAALRKVFGSGVIQLGSDNNEKRLRIDFPLEYRPSLQELQKVEKHVNTFIKQKIPRQYILTTYEKGLQMGAIALHEGNYTGQVRVVGFDKILEFCGGTHIANTSLIEKFKITKFESKGKGIFRVEAITREEIEFYEINQMKNLQTQIGKLILKNQQLDSDYDYPQKKIQNLEDAQMIFKKLQEDNKKLHKLAQNINLDLPIKFTTYEGKPTYWNLSLKTLGLKEQALYLRDKNPNNLVILGSSQNGKMTLVVASHKYNAKEIFDAIIAKNGGRGGGNAKFSMGVVPKFVL